MKRQALIVVDMQTDFLSKEGKAYIRGSEKIIPAVNTLVDTFHDNGHLVVFARDWHPLNHVSFRQRREHCVANSPGAMLGAGLQIPGGHFLVLNKGTDRKEDTLSAFGAFDGYFKLGHFLELERVEEVFISGLSPEYCISATATDSVDAGYNTYVVDNATKFSTAEIKAKTLRTLKVSGAAAVTLKRAVQSVSRVTVS